MKLTLDLIENAVKDKGYNWFDKGDYNLNIVGVRNSKTNNEVTNKFDDKITLSYKVDGTTTIPFIFVCLFKALSVVTVVCAMVCPTNNSNMDGCYDLDDDNTQTGYFGINIHRATAREGKKSTQVDKWSAGCQVIASNDDWNDFIFACYKAREIWGNKFTYTLINSDDIYETT